MEWTIPGTVLSMERSEAQGVAQVFRSMFLAGDMALGQVASISGLEPYMVQNWVKRGYLSPPQNKRYSMNQLCRILNINMLRGALTIDAVCRLLSYINGQLDDDSDDLIDDSELYFMFVRLAARTEVHRDPAVWAEDVDALLSNFEEKIPGAKDRVARVLQVMLAAWVSTTMRRRAEQLLTDMEKE